MVDTQGIYRIRTSVQEWGAIFALSSLISSIQIYSLETHIGTDTLQCLEVVELLMQVDYNDVECSGSNII